MDELTFLLILAGIGIVLLVAMFTYYRHHKKIHDEIQDFNRHHDMDDVLLDDHSKANPFHAPLKDEELPSSFNSGEYDNIDFDKIFNKSQNSRADNNDSSQVTTAAPVIPNRRASVAEAVSDAQPLSGAQRTSEITPPGTDKQPPETNPPQIVNETQVTEKQSVNSRSASITSADTGEPEKPPATISAQHKTPQTIELIYEPLPKDVNDLILSFTIVSRGEKFTGLNLVKAFEESGLRFGEMNIFHYPGDNKPQTYALFSAANLVEPGTFNMHELESFSSPGISLFMRLPTRKSAFDAFDEFLHTSRQLAQKLSGELCDEARNQLTQQSISHKKEQIKKLQFELTKARKIAELSK